MVFAVGLDEDVGQHRQVYNVASVRVPRHMVNLVLYVRDRLAQVSITPLTLLEAHFAALKSAFRTWTYAGWPLTYCTIWAWFKTKIVFL